MNEYIITHEWIEHKRSITTMIEVVAGWNGIRWMNEWMKWSDWN